MATDIQHEVIIPTRCGEAALTSLIDRIRPLFTWYSPGSNDNIIHTRLTRSHDTHVDLLCNGGTVVAFAISVLMVLEGGERCLFRHGTIISEAYRSRGFYGRLLDIGLSRHHPDWHATKTQNPRIYETWRKIHGAMLLPSMSRQPTEREKAIARALAHGSAFDDNTFVSRGIFREDRSQAEYHTCRSSEIYSFFSRSLGIHDAFILLARV